MQKIKNKKETINIIYRSLGGGRDTSGEDMKGTTVKKGLPVTFALLPCA